MTCYVIFYDSSSKRKKNYNPDFFEYTFSANDRLTKFKKGDIVFFHTTSKINGKQKRVIVGYLCVKEVEYTSVYKKKLKDHLKTNKSIISYSNPYIINNEMIEMYPERKCIVFFDPVNSKFILDNPLIFDEKIVKVLSSLDIDLTKDMTNRKKKVSLLSRISEKTRQWRTITDDEYEKLKKKVDDNYNDIDKKNRLFYLKENDEKQHNFYINYVINNYSSYNTFITFVYQRPDLLKLEKDIIVYDAKIKRFMNILKIYKTIQLEKLKKYLDFKTIEELELWLIEECNKFSFKIDRNILIILKDDV